MAANLRLGNVVFCEYVGRGENGKFLLINVYSGDIVLSAFPAALAAALYFEFYPGDQRDMHAKLELFMGDLKVFEANSHFAETKLSDPAIVNTPQFFINLDKPVKIRATLAIKGFKSATLLTKEIRGPSALATA